jgi:hypothetical protein
MLGYTPACRIIAAIGFRAEPSSYGPERRRLTDAECAEIMIAEKGAAMIKGAAWQRLAA